MRSELQVLDVWLRLVGGPDRGDVVFIEQGQELTHATVCRNLWVVLPSDVSLMSSCRAPGGQQSLIARELVLAAPVVDVGDILWAMRTRCELGLPGGSLDRIIVAEIAPLEPLRIGAVYSKTDIPRRGEYEAVRTPDMDRGQLAPVMREAWRLMDMAPFREGR